MGNSNSVVSIIVNGDILVAVPNSLTLMTPYVLYEQGDWFEDEIHFVRHFVKPGMQVLDIGANYGLYTLSIAKILNGKGKVWAFEPTKSTFNCLEKSVEENTFKNVELLQTGLSNRIGDAQLHTSINSELNTLCKNTIPGENSETIKLSTLDHCFSNFRWKNIDFIKLDAEGEELNILEASGDILSSLSPLIMFELKHGEAVNISLVNKFRKMGYDTYRLIPGLNVLIPFDETQDFDGYLLNLFCCKEDRAKQLKVADLIVTEWEAAAPKNFDHAAALIYSNKFCSGAQDILKGIEALEDSPYSQVLSSYIAFQSNEYTLKQRLSYLMYSLDKAKQIIYNGTDDIGQLSTFSRIAFDAGERVLGVEILNKLIQKYPNDLNFELVSPFLPAHSLYELTSPKDKIREWLFSSILEQFIEKHAFSTYFSGKKVQSHFSRLENLGFMSTSMSRRYALLMKVFV